ncbi:MAG: hypothetical protein AB2L12_15735 [Smithellaceae bacterium]
MIFFAINDYKITLPYSKHEEKINMPTVMPEGKNVEKAIKWISASIEENEKQSVPQLVNKAVLKFDLSPKDTEFLLGFFKNRKAEK